MLILSVLICCIYTVHVFMYIFRANIQYVMHFVDVAYLIGFEHLHSSIYFPLKKGDDSIFISHDFIKSEAEKQQNILKIRGFSRENKMHRTIPDGY